MTGQEDIILNVDDTEAIRYAKSRALRRAGFTVVEACTGGEALARVAEVRPVLALLDVKLPDMSGLDVCRVIKRDFPGTMVLQTSASFVETAHRVRGLDSGADSYLTEPVEPAELVAAVRALLRLRHAEDSLRRLNATLEERVQARTAELAAANARLRGEMLERQRVEEALRQSQKMEAIGQLTGGLAHDFNNLLTGIVGGLAMIKRRIAQGRMPDVDRYADGAIASATRAASLTHRLLAFARRQPLDPRPIDVNRLVRSMEELVRRTLGPSIQLEADLVGFWPALCDANQLESALLNLVINARDAMPEGGRLTIATGHTTVAEEEELPGQEAVPGDYLSLRVTDTGTGMLPEILERAFDPFFTTKPIGQGTGLGLSQLYGFVRQSGGHTRITSQPGRGTTVSIFLPRHHGGALPAALPPVDAARAEAATRAPSGTVGRTGAGTTVLVVEDEPVVRMLMVDALHELGYAVLEAGNGPSGLRILRAAPRVDLLITDLGLPDGQDGREVAAVARRERPDLKVLFITGYAESVAREPPALDAGMALVTKPFTLDALIARILALLGEQEHR